MLGDGWSPSGLIESLGKWCGEAGMTMEFNQFMKDRRECMQFAFDELDRLKIQALRFVSPCASVLMLNCATLDMERCRSRYLRRCKSSSRSLCYRSALPPTGLCWSGDCAKCRRQTNTRNSGRSAMKSSAVRDVELT